MQTLIQTQSPVNTQSDAARIHAQMVQCLTPIYLDALTRYPNENWERLYGVWAEAWSDDRGIDITSFPVPCDPAITVNEDAALWYTSIFSGINQF